MQHPDEGMIHAWLDGELSADEARDVESHVAECGECSARVAEARGLIAGSSRIVSALDVVPAGVIPPSLPGRAWYSSVQFRAAAGILVVAGASLLLLNRDQPRAAQRAMAESKKQPVESPMPMLAAGSAESTSHPISPQSNPQQPTPARALERARRTEAAQEQKSVDAAADMAAANALAAPTVAAPAPAPAQPQPQAKRIVLDSSVRINEVVVTGVATAVEAPLRLLTSDTSQLAVKNVYEVRKGVEVTLVESTLPPRNFTASSTQKARGARPMVAAAPPPPAAEGEPATNSISWSKGDKVFTLTGMMTRIQLEAIRLKLPEDKR